MTHLDMLQYMALVMIIAGAITFFVLLFIPTPYGRNTSSKFGPPVSAQLAWLIQEAPALAIPLWYIFHFFHSNPWNSSELIEFLIMLGPFVVHYFQRSLIYPLLIRGGKPTPAVPFVLACIFCTYNGYLQSSYIVNYGHLSWDFAAVAGLALFAAGMLANLHSDHILRSLRRPGESGYKIPQGGLFNLVSGANFLGEIVEWWGFALLNRSLPAVAFAVFTTANIAPRAWHHHRWYLDKFGSDYPKGRRAIIPYLL